MAFVPNGPKAHALVELGMRLRHFHLRFTTVATATLAPTTLASTALASTGRHRLPNTTLIGGHQIGADRCFLDTLAPLLRPVYILKLSRTQYILKLSTFETQWSYVCFRPKTGGGVAGKVLTHGFMKKEPHHCAEEGTPVYLL